VNLSGTQPRIYDESLLLGLLSVESVGATVAERIVAERDMNGDFRSIPDLMTRTGIRQEALDNLTDAGALDSLSVIPRKDDDEALSSSVVPAGPPPGLSPSPSMGEGWGEGGYSRLETSNSRKTEVYP